MPALTTNREPQFEEAAMRSEALYEHHLRDTLEREHMGEIVAIHLGSGDYFVARYRQAAIPELLAKHPKDLMLVTRIGPPTAGDLIDFP